MINSYIKERMIKMLEAGFFPEPESPPNKPTQIICPRCKSIESAKIEFENFLPFPSYVHECAKCAYIITESEWQELDSEK